MHNASLGAEEFVLSRSRAVQAVAVSMAAFSKEWQSFTCQEALHPDTPSCYRAALAMSSHAGLGCSRFFIAMYLLQLLLKIQKGKADRVYLKNHLKGFGRSVLFACTLCGIFMSSSCILRAVFGRYFRYTAVFLPTLLAAPAIFLERPFKRNLYAYTFFQMVLDYVVALLKAGGMRSLHPAFETLLFMVTNSALLYLARTDTSKKPVYWFFLPTATDRKGEEDEVSEKNTNGKVCSHPHTCLKNTLTSSLQYAGIGIGIQVVQGIAKRFGAFMRAPSATLATILWNKDILRLGAFFGVYVGLYKSITCALRRTCGGEEDSHTVLAAFLAGFAYRFNRDRTWALSAGTMVVQLLLRRARSKGFLPEPPFMAELVFIVCCAMLFQVRFLDSQNCPRFIARTLSTATNGRVEYIYSNFEKRASDFMLRSQT